MPNKKFSADQIHAQRFKLPTRWSLMIEPRKAIDRIRVDNASATVNQIAPSCA